MDQDKIKTGVRLILEGIGEDPDRPGLQKTPQRVADMYEDIFSGIDAPDPAELLTAIPGDHHREMVLIRDIDFYSICEHHLLPFHGVAHVAYIPSNHGHIAGLEQAGARGPAGGGAAAAAGAHHQRGRRRHRDRAASPPARSCSSRPSTCA